MAVRDTEAFIRQQAALFDPNLDLNPGSPFDVRVIQPIVRRFGADPFTVDMSTFLNTRLLQAFPDLATKEGDALTDLLVKPATLLWDPIVREITLTRNQLSFADPTLLTTDEAEALGANLFSERETGDLARGSARLFFVQPQNVAISPINFVTSRTGLHFFPTEIQSIRTEEMVLNLDSSGLFFFDINVEAEASGLQFNIPANSLTSIANIASAVRVTNLRRFQSGLAEETAAEFVDRARQELTERSLVTLRGVGAKLTKSFPEVRRLNVVGFNDPEMQRDVVTGGGLGDIIASGSAGSATADGEAKSLTRRFFTSEVDFISLIGPTTIAPVEHVLTVWDAFGTSVSARDLDVLAVVNANELDLVEQVMVYSLSSSEPLRWTLRRKELTLSDIPGGILFPDGPNGTVVIPEGQVHVGGATDMLVRAASFDEATLIIDNVTDDEPGLSGDELFLTTTADVLELQDLVLGGNYVVGDTTHQLLENAREFAFSLQILTGVDAGTYRIQGVTQTLGSSPLIDVERDTIGAALSGPFRWKIVDQINIDLVDPRETRISANDLTTVQGQALVSTLGGTDFDILGVAKDDILRILEGPDAGDFTLIADPITPGFTSLSINATLTSTQSGLSYTIFRPNAEGGVNRPIVRVTKVELLDTSNQSQGTIIPYALPIDIQSRAFQNPARGVKHDLVDARLGIVSVRAVSGSFVMGGTTLLFNLLDGSASATITLSSSTLSIATLLSELNAGLETAFGIANGAVQVGTAGAFATGRLNVVPPSQLVDGETFTLDDGVNPAVIFEFDVTGTNTPAPGNIEIDVSGDATADDVKTTIIGVINITPSINITASNGGVGIVALTNDDLLAVGNVPITETVANVNFTVSGMSGGVDGGDRIGIRPIGPDGKIAVVGGTAKNLLFGLTSGPITSMDVRSEFVDGEGGWAALDPFIDFSTRLDIIQVIDGNQVGFFEAPYTVGSVTDLISGSGTELTDALLVTNAAFTEFSTFAPEADVHLQIGARSLGSVRCFFLEPTSIEFDTDSRFSVDTDNGVLRFLPDPTLDAQKIPPLPNGITPKDGSAPKTAGPAIFTSALSDFTLSSVRPGDELLIENFPLGGTIALTDPVPSLVNKTFVYSLDNGPDRSVVFIKDDASLAAGEVTRQGVVDQINASAGVEICSLTTGNELEFETDLDLVIRTTSTALPDILGDIAGTSPPIPFTAANALQRSNRSPHAGRHTITIVTPTTVTVASLSVTSDYTAYADPVVRQSFKIVRPGAQRISTTQMTDNKVEADLFFFDVELISEGTGDLWNIDAALQLTAAGFRSDGFFLTTDDPNLTFSDVEQLKMVLSRSILEDGVDDAPENATQLTGQNIQITYDRSTLVADVQNFISSETERVICQSPLSRHLIPHFVRFDLTYTGGSSEEVTVPEVEDLILGVFPNELLEVSDVEKIFTDRGAISITNPIDLIAIVHNVDRTITAQRSQNALGTGRLSAFIPDILNITRNVT